MTSGPPPAPAVVDRDRLMPCTAAGGWMLAVRAGQVSR